MKTLFILRHGKAKSPGSCADRDRTLKSRGREDAARMGRHLASHYDAPDLCLVSSAARTIETHAIVSEVAAWEARVYVDDDLYLPILPMIFERLSDVPEHIQRLVLIGHNPGLEQLVEAATGVGVTLPTTGLAVVQFHHPNWDILSCRGDLLEHTRGSEVGG